jgi:hypothetical protein
MKVGDIHNLDKILLRTQNGFLIITSSPCDKSGESASQVEKALENAYREKIKNNDYNIKNVEQFMKEQDD